MSKKPTAQLPRLASPLIVMDDSFSLKNDDGTISAPRFCGYPMSRVGHNSPTAFHVFECGTCGSQQSVQHWHGENSL